MFIRQKRASSSWVWFSYFCFSTMLKKHIKDRSYRSQSTFSQTMIELAKIWLRSSTLMPQRLKLFINISPLYSSRTHLRPISRLYTYKYAPALTTIACPGHSKLIDNSILKAFRSSLLLVNDIHFNRKRESETRIIIDKRDSFCPLLF